MNARKLIAEALRENLDRKYKIVDSPRNLDQIEANKPVVQIIQTKLRPAPNKLGAYLADVAVWVIEPKTIAAEDDLDDAMLDVAVALDKLDSLAWTEAERSTYGEDQPAYRFQTTVVIIIESKE
ncbi:hypothetical protein KXS11_03430 [Plantibacter flavus]|uniref:hypothetical protein n=1 Tax=Plantibacter flavus TaxID=150123 RepID=UPI003F17D6EB